MLSLTEWVWEFRNYALWDTIDLIMLVLIMLSYLFNFTERTAYGAGSYFSATAKYSDAYATDINNPTTNRFMILASVTTGRYCQGHQNMKTLPYIPGSATDQYDSAVDNCNGEPQIFVVFHDSAAYPQYVIEYSVL